MLLFTVRRCPHCPTFLRLTVPHLPSISPVDDKNKKQRKRKNIRKMLSDDELAEETRLEQEREMERIRWLRELHEKSQAEEREKKKLLQEERKKQKSGDSSNPVMILVDDSDGETVADKKYCEISLNTL